MSSICLKCEKRYNDKKGLTKHMDTCKVLRDQDLKEETDQIKLEYEQKILSLTAHLEEYARDKEERITNYEKGYKHNIHVLTQSYKKLEEKNEELRKEIHLLQEELRESHRYERTLRRELIEYIVQRQSD